MKRKRRMGGDDELNITSMMDMMTIILVFLLKSFGASELTVTPSDTFELPSSSSILKPLTSPSVVIRRPGPGYPVTVISEESKELPITIASVPVEDSSDVTFRIPAEEKDGANINELYTELKRISDGKQKIIDAMKKKIAASGRSDVELPKMGQLLLQIDKEIPFQIVKEVMFTAGQAKFNEFQFVVIGPME
jgi:biopolymer transport protein ExbD